MMRRCLLGVCICLAMAGAMGGCASAREASNSRTAIQVLLNQWKAAFVANNLDAILPLYSEHFQSNGRGKAFLAEYLKEAMAEGAGADVKINTDISTITIQGNTATVLPVAVCGRVGSDSLRLDLAKEDGQWRIVGMTGKHL